MSSQLGLCIERLTAYIATVPFQIIVPIQVYAILRSIIRSLATFRANISECLWPYLV